jgi:sugar/nucleoside kinase (ribokinase family)
MLKNFRHNHNIKKIIGVPKLIELINDATLLGLENWTMLPYMSEIWKGLLSEVFPQVKPAAQKRYVFFDLADPEKRTKEDILEALGLIKKFGDYFQVILGLNLKEAVEIAVILGCDGYDVGDIKNIELKKLVEQVAAKLDLYSLVVHPTSEAATVIGGTYYHVEGPYTAKPKLTTGAGDNFNAGFCLGQILDLTPEQSILLGVATSGYYVRNAGSPTLENVIAFLKSWSEGRV